MKEFLCLNKKTNCNYSFKSEAEFEEHKRSGHTVPGLSLAPAEPNGPVELNPEAPPPPEFVEAVKRIEAQKETPKEAEEPRTTTGGVERKPLPDPKPIKLNYQFSGECSEHRVPVTTIELDVATKHFCVAFCPPGNHQLESREVAKL